MLLKLLTLIGALLAVWGMARRVLGAGAPPPARPGAAADLVRCGRCGAWRAPEGPCPCATPPTP